METVNECQTMGFHVLKNVKSWEMLKFVKPWKLLKIVKPCMLKNPNEC